MTWSTAKEAAKATADKFVSCIKENAELVEETVWGKRRLAYPINDKPEGYYVVATFKADALFPAELERLMNIDEMILRSMVIRLEHEAVAKAPATEEVPAQKNPLLPLKQKLPPTQSNPGGKQRKGGVRIGKLQFQQNHSWRQTDR